MHLADHIRKQSLFTDKARKLHPTGVRIQRKAGIWCSLVLEGVSNTYIVMTERKTRREIIIPSPDKTSASVVAALDTLEKKVGSKVFPLIFQSITCDNGCEFADAAGIERSITGRGPRTEVYYCHPYRPSERGSNENQNGLIRRHLPKGTDLSTISYEETKRIEDWLNNYPRKMFGYLCSEQLFREEIALILAS